MKDPREEQAEKEAKKGEEIRAKLYNISEESVPIEVPETQVESKPEEKKPDEQTEKLDVKSEVELQPKEKSKPDKKKSGEESWEVKYKALQGVHNTEIAKMKARAEEAEKKANEWKDTVAEIGKYKVTETKPQQEPIKPPEPEVVKVGSVIGQPQKYVTDKDLEDYGSDQLSYVRRVAKEVAEEVMYNSNKTISDVIEKRFNQIENKFVPVTDELKTVKTTQTKSIQQKFWEDMDRLCPDLQDYNYDPVFNKWLDQPSIEAGFVRRKLFENAFYELDVSRVARLFNVFKESLKTNELVTNQPESIVAEQQAVASENPQLVSSVQQPEIPVAGKQIPIINIESLISPGVSKAGSSAIAMEEGSEPPYSLGRWKQKQAEYARKHISLEELEQEKNLFEAALRGGRLVP